MRKGLVVWIVLVILAGTGVPRPAAAQAGCGQAHCLYLPLASQPLPPVEVKSAGYVWRDQLYRISGAISSSSGDPVYAVSMQANLYDQDGLLLASSGGLPAFDATLPGQPNPFVFIFPVPVPGGSSYRIFITGWSLTSPLDYQPAAVLSRQILSDWDSTEVSGEIRNDQAREMRAIRVVVMPGTGGSYQVADLSQDTLAPGEISRYSATIFHAFEEPPASINVEAQGYLAP